MGQYKTRSYQTVYDLTIQLYGDMSNIGKLLRLFPTLDDRIAPSEVFDTEATTDPIAKYFTDRAIVIATDIIASEADIGIGNFRILESGEYRVLENGDLRIIE